jgi:DegV family protein with EDD domain
MAKLGVCSACDLPKELVSKYNIGVAQCDVIIGDKSYEDCEKPADDIYAELAHGKIVTTSAPSPWKWKTLIGQMLSDADDTAIILTLPKKVSHDYDSAFNAALELRNDYKGKKHIEIIDSKAVSGALGLTTIRIAEHLNDYKELLKEYKDRISEYLREQIESIREKIKVYASLDDTTQLLRSGRINLTQHFLSSLLKVRPILSMNESGDVISVAKSRYSIGAMKKIEEKIENDINIVKPGKVHTMFMHGNSPDRIEELKQRVSELLKRYNLENISYAVSRVGAAIGSHGGPTFYGVALSLE